MTEGSDVLTIVIRLGDDILQKLQMKFSIGSKGEALSLERLRRLEVVEVAFGKAQ
jgi:hypothetical protein